MSEMETGLDIIQGIFKRRINNEDFLKILDNLSEPELMRLVSKMSEHMQRLAALVEVSDKVSDTLSLNELFPRMMDLMTQTMHAERSTLFLYDPQTQELFSRLAQGDGIGEIRITPDSGIAGAVFSSGKSEIIPDAYADPRFNQNVDRQTGYTTKNILCAPVRNKDQEVVGVMQVLNKRDGPFTHDDRRLLELVGAQAAAALQNGLLFEQVERARWEEAKLLEITSAISSELQVGDLLRRIIEVATDLLDADRGTLFLHDAKTDELWSMVAEGLNTKELRLPANAGLVGQTFSDGEVLNIPDAYADPRFNPEVDRKTGYKTNNIICMPIINKDGKKLGVMQILNKQHGPFSILDERRLRSFAAQAAIALENAQLFEDMQNARNYNESILRSLTNGVITLDAERRIIKVNPAAARILNWDADQYNEASITDLFDQDNLWLLNSIEKVAKTGEIDLAMDQEMKLPHGSFSLNTTVVPLVDIKEARIGYMIIIEDISREKRVKSTMSRYMPKEVVDQLVDDEEQVLGGALQEISILFSDIRSFTTISESLGAKGTVSMLNEYFTEMVEVIFENGGILDKYIGDAIMALFGTPFRSPLDADNAVRTANSMVKVLRRLNQRRVQKGQYRLDIGLGIATGEVIAGNIGSPKRMDYTVIGDSVNLAARLEAANKAYGTNILICDNTRKALKTGAKLREIDLLRVKGKTKPVAVFETLDFHTPKTFPNMDEALEIYKNGLALYRQRAFHPAMVTFKQAAKINPNDGPTQCYVERCQHYLESPPRKSWDGVWEMTTK